MLVKTPDNEILNVFQIFWNSQYTSLGILRPNTGGLNVIYLHEVEVMDPSFNFRTALFQGENGTMLAHWALIEKKLLDDFIDHSKSAYLEFLEIIKKEGIVDEDFF